MNKIVSKLAKTEQEDSATCITISRVMRFSDIEIKDGIDKNRLCTKIKKYRRIEKRIIEEKWLEKLYN